MKAQTGKHKLALGPWRKLGLVLGFLGMLSLSIVISSSNAVYSQARSPVLAPDEEHAPVPAEPAQLSLQFQLPMVVQGDKSLGDAEGLYPILPLGLDSEGELLPGHHPLLFRPPRIEV